MAMAVTSDTMGSASEMKWQYTSPRWKWPSARNGEKPERRKGLVDGKGAVYLRAYLAFELGLRVVAAEDAHVYPGRSPSVVESSVGGVDVKSGEARHLDAAARDLAEALGVKRHGKARDVDGVVGMRFVPEEHDLLEGAEPAGHCLAGQRRAHVRRVRRGLQRLRTGIGLQCHGTSFRVVL